MIEDIEISPTDRAKCKGCGNLIGKGTPRGVITTKQNYGYSNSYYCYKCSLLKIERDKKDLDETKKQLKKLIKKHTKEIVLMEL